MKVMRLTWEPVRNVFLAKTWDYPPKVVAVLYCWWHEDLGYDHWEWIATADASVHRLTAAPLESGLLWYEVEDNEKRAQTEAECQIFRFLRRAMSDDQRGGAA